MKSKPLEISIVGAGIGGLVAALALKKNPIKKGRGPKGKIFLLNFFRKGFRHGVEIPIGARRKVQEEIEDVQ